MRIDRVSGVLVVAVWGSILACQAFAQDPPDVSAPLGKAPLTKEQIENPPAREIKVQELSEPHARPLYRPQPSLVEQKFMAIVPFEIPKGDTNLDSPLPRSHPLYDLQAFGGSEKFLNPTVNLRADRPGLADAFARLLEHAPDSVLPQAEREFFRSAEVDIGFVVLSNNARWTWSSSRRSEGSTTPDKYVQQFMILGKSAKECEQRARALITLLDHGFSRPLQLAILETRDQYAEEFNKRQEVYLTAQASLPALKKTLAEYADLSNDMLTGLRLQQREAEIKIAGTKARLAAAEKLLAQARGDGAAEARLLPIEQAKFTAEIELADLEARQAKAQELVGKVTTRIDLSTQIEATEKSSSSRRGTLASYLSRLQSLDHELVRHGPVPLVDNKIFIQPVEWTTP